MKKEQGFIKFIIIIIIAVLILSYYGISLQAVAESPTARANFGFIKELVLWIWTYILKTPVMFIWNVVLVPLFALLAHK